jgi:hypothetical protein
MRYALINNYKIPSKNIIALKSVSNTIGNAKEIYKYFVKKNIKNLNKVGILTNFYDLPRSIKIFREFSNLSLIPICAESIIYDEEFDLIKKFYKEEGFSRIVSEEKNYDSEIKGISDREKGCYVPRFK